MLDTDSVPAKRLRYSPESKHAPKPQNIHLHQKENREHIESVLQPSTIDASPSRSSGSAVTHAESDSASDHATTSQTHAAGKSLRASATPWTPAVSSIWSNVSEPSRGWRGGSFDISMFGAVKASTTATHSEATQEDATASMSRIAQVHKLQLSVLATFSWTMQSGLTGVCYLGAGWDANGPVRS